jgi:peptide/nickel transport system ATP-binding protein
MTDPILEVRNLKTYFFTDLGVVRAVDDVSFEVFPGETLGIVGESGSGKSVTAMSIIRLLEDPSRIVNGEILFRGKDIVKMMPNELCSLRGGSIAMVFQDPMTSLNPVLRIARQLIEAMLVHGRYTKNAARERAIDLLKRMGITGAEQVIRSYPHQFSGGMRQRVMMAMGFSNDPTLLIADEPTTALDVTIQAQILDLLKQLNQEFQTAIILISHDLGVVAKLCSRAIVMYGGEIVEKGLVEDLLSVPRHPYTWALINAVPRLDVAEQRRLTVIEGMPPDPLHHPTGCRFSPRCPFRIDKCDQHPQLVEISPGHLTACWVTQEGVRLPNSRIGDDSQPVAEITRLPDKAQASHYKELSLNTRKVGQNVELAAGVQYLELKNITKYFQIGTSWIPGQKPLLLRAVGDVNLKVIQGETVGLVGESGCGKSTLARLMVNLYKPTQGEVWFEGRKISGLGQAEMRPYRQRMQMIFQDPYASLNPRMKVGEIVGESLLFHNIVPNRKAAEARVKELLDLVGLNPRAIDQHPHEFSGGQRQRIGIARALAVNPHLIVADEPISSLDVNIQAQIINLLEDLQEVFKLTYIFISHDLSVVRHASDRIVVLYLGKVMEIASSKHIIEEPLHPYSKSLISAVPIADAKLARTRQRIRLEGEIPSQYNPPRGCPFNTRCPIVKPICVEQGPDLMEHLPGQWAACYFPGELKN